MKHYQCLAAAGLLAVASTANGASITSPPDSTSHLAPNWETVRLELGPCYGTGTVTCESGPYFRVDDSGHYFDSASGTSGRLPEFELERIDSRIDAIKDEALDPLVCSLEWSALFGFSIHLTFLDTSKAVVYTEHPERSEICWSGDYTAVILLFNELVFLRDIYT